MIYGDVASLKHVQSVDDLPFIWNACSPKVSVLLVMVIVPYALLFHVPMRPLSNVHPFTELQTQLLSLCLKGLNS